MKTALVILATAAATGMLAMYIIRRIQSNRMRRKIASEGFETASDILYPKKRRMFSKYKMSPVLPH